MDEMDQFEEVVVLVDEDGNEIEFYQIAVVELEDKLYACLEPTSKLEGFEDGDLLIFEIDVSDDEEQFLPVENQDIVDAVFNEFLKLQEDYEE